MFVGAGDGPCAILMMGSARVEEKKLHYPVDPVAAKHGAAAPRGERRPGARRSRLAGRVRADARELAAKGVTAGTSAVREHVPSLRPPLRLYVDVGEQEDDQGRRPQIQGGCASTSS